MTNLLEFANTIGKVIEIKSRPNNKPWRKWCCRFSQGYVKQESSLVVLGGNGNTPETAIWDYEKNIAGRTLVFTSESGETKEYDVPRDLGKMRPIWGGKL